MTWLRALTKAKQHGSYPRCLLLTEGERGAVADCLTRLVDLTDIRVEAAHLMPRGLPIRTPDGGWDTTPTREARVDRDPGFLSAEQREAVRAWWLAVPKNANTPNWDIACTCTICGKPGLLFVEAKAHASELHAAGKKEPSSSNGRLNHRRIGCAIAQANAGLDAALPGWALSRDSHYQLANRFAWAWKIASLGVPVVLVWLGFLQADEMSDQGTPFGDAKQWIARVINHSQGCVPAAVWDQCLDIGGTPLIPLIRSKRIDLPEWPGFRRRNG